MQCTVPFKGLDVSHLLGRHMRAKFLT